MFAQWKLIAAGILAVTLIGLGVTVKKLYDRNMELSTQIEQYESHIEQVEKNLELVTDQLVLEQQIREAAEASLLELRDVPNEVYNEVLPPDVSRVLRNFRERMQ